MARPPFPAQPLSVDPQRLLDGDGTLSPLARDLLRAMPPVKPLEAHVAMRVRTSVLQTPGASVNPGQAAKSVRPSPSAAYVKLGAVAGTAALFGAGVMTLVSSVVNAPAGQFGTPNDRSGVVVVSATRTTGAPHQGERSPSEVDVAKVYGGTEGSTTSAGSAGVNALAGASSPTASGAGSAALAAGAITANDDGGNGAARREDAAPRVGPADGELIPREAASNAETKTGDLADADRVLSVDDLQAADEQLFAGAGRHANHDSRVMVRPAFRRIASSSDGTSAQSSHRKTSLRTLAVTSLEQETLLLEEARSKLGRDPEAALDLALEHQSRFRRGQLLEQRRMIHLEALLRLGRDVEAQDLAKSIGNSLYRARAKALLEKYGI